MRILIACLLFFAATSSVGQSTVTIVTEFSPPHQTRINDTVSGYSTNIVRMLLAEAKINSTISIYPWARAYKMATYQKNTLIYSLARTPEREPLFHWIAPVAHFKLGFVKLTQRDDILINNTQHAKQYKIAVQRNDLAYMVLNKHGFDLLLTSDIQKSYHLLLAGKVDLIIDDANYMAAMSEYLAINSEQLSFVYAIDELMVDGYLAANLDTDPDILNVLSTAFLKIKDTEKYNNLMRAN